MSLTISGGEDPTELLLPRFLSFPGSFFLSSLRVLGWFVCRPMDLREERWKDVSSEKCGFRVTANVIERVDIFMLIKRSELC